MGAMFRGTGGGPGAGLTRRALLRAAVGGAGAIAMGGTLAGCATASPTTASNRTLLTFRAYFYPFNTPLSLVYEWTAPFRAQNKSLDIKVMPYYPNCCDVPSNLAQVAAGMSPDLMDVNSPTPYMEEGAFIPLDPLIETSNVDLTLITTGQNVCHSRDGHLYGLPTSPGVVAYAANLGLLDELGLPRPSPTWDLAEAEDLWRRIAQNTTAGHRFGTDFFWAFGDRGPNACYLHGWGGSYVDPQDATKCNLGDPKSIAAGNWLFGLIQEQVAQPGPSPWSQFVGGQVAFRTIGNWAMVNMAEQAYQNDLKWDFYPFPSWPQGAWTATNRDMFGIPVSAKHPKEAWELLRWITFEPYYQQQLLRATLIAPVLKSLLSEWTARLELLAPPLQGKNLSVLVDPLTTGRLTPDANFQYDNDGANLLIGKAIGTIASGVSVAEAFSSVADQVNRYEQTYAQMNKTQRRQKEAPARVPPTPPVEVGTPWDTPELLQQTLAQTLRVPGGLLGVGAAVPTWGTSASGCTLTLRQGGPSGKAVATKAFTNVQDNSWLVLNLPAAAPAGTYTLELSQPTGPKIGWWLDSQSALPGGQAYSNGSPIKGTFTAEYYPQASA